MLEVVLLVNLKTQDAGVVPKGTRFKGALSELPAFVARLVKEKQTDICCITEVVAKPAPQGGSVGRKKRSK